MKWDNPSTPGPTKAPALRSLRLGDVPSTAVCCSGVLCQGFGWFLASPQRIPQNTHSEAGRLSEDAVVETRCSVLSSHPQSPQPSSSSHSLRGPTSPVTPLETTSSNASTNHQASRKSSCSRLKQFSRSVEPCFLDLFRARKPM